MHILPQLRKLEDKYRNELVIIGVHSAKFIAESITKNIHQAVRRYQIYHPVINDKNLSTWQQYNIQVWPTIIVIDPDGNIDCRIEGEVSFEKLDSVVNNIYSNSGKYNNKNSESSYHAQEEIFDNDERTLSFPGKIIADLAANRLLISDSNHNRILITSEQGYVLDIIGSGHSGFIDGPSSIAQFCNPQGMAIKNGMLFIADTGNHAIRKVNIQNGTVETVAYNKHGVSSPWDLAYEEKILYIAMAGVHQIWDMDTEDNNILALAGTGHEDLVDGQPNKACLAQPSGIAINRGTIYFVDSETSSVRMLPLQGNQKVQTLIGKGLFDFGDIDGNTQSARLQHPLGLALYQDSIYIADTYNNKIKMLKVDALETTTIAGTGFPGHNDGKVETASFYEPGGLAMLKGNIYVADTNNHSIRVIDISLGKVHTLTLKNI